MRIINKKYLLIIILIGIILTGVILGKPNKKVQLDNVILKQEVNNKTFAMYKEEGESYVPVEGTEFPKMYVLNFTESKCIDNNGNEIKDALSYENDEVVLTTNKSSYCYLYFDKSLGLEIKDVNSNGLKTDKVRGEMYRYQGQQTDKVENYICFGTSDEATCAGDTDKYMYRIIGIEASTGRVKVIKKEALNTALRWWYNYNEDIEFPESNIYKAISGSDFLENDDYVPVGWEEKIANNTWMYGDILSNDILGARQTGEELYLTETGQKETQWYNYATEETPGAIKTTVGYEQSPYKGNTVYYTNGNGNWTQSFDGKVSLMYLHDYHYSVSDIANCQYDEGKYAECKTGWMHLSQNDPGAPSVHVWTMSRSGWLTWAGWFYGHYVNNGGCTDDWPLSSSYSVRPVFYLASVNELAGGDGTLEHPFRIK